jgi:hypothetical protein
MNNNQEVTVEAITWKDITHMQGQPRNTRVELLEYISIGMVIFEDDNVVEIQDTWSMCDEHDNRDRFANSVLCIPKGCIIDRIKFLREDSCIQNKEE